MQTSGIIGADSGTLCTNTGTQVISGFGGQKRPLITRIELYNESTTTPELVKVYDAISATDPNRRLLAVRYLPAITEPDFKRYHSVISFEECPLHLDYGLLVVTTTANGARCIYYEKV